MFLLSSGYDVSEDSIYSLENSDELAEVFHSFSNPHRAQAYDLLAQGYTLPEINEELAISRSGLQNYFDNFRSVGLAERTGRGEYALTPKGEWAYEQFLNIDESYGEWIEEQRERELQDLLDRWDIEPGSEEATELFKDLLKEE